MVRSFAGLAGLMPVGSIAAGSLMVVTLFGTSSCGKGEETQANALPLSIDGEASYARNCSVCHGATGRGDGPAAHYLDPRPRDFGRGSFRLVSTKNQVPTEDDIARTIRLGIPGTGMPPWSHLSDEEQKNLTQHVLKLRKDEIIRASVASGKSQADAEARARKLMTPGEVINPPPMPANISMEDAKKVFIETCAKCHGDDGTGKNDPTWRTEEGFPIKSRNFVRGVFKGGRDSIELYRRTAAGMPGTPMPAFGALEPDYIWKMVKYIESLSDPKAQERAWVKPVTISVKKVAALPKDANDAGWQGAPAVSIAVFPLWANDDAVDSVVVRALYDSYRIGFMLEWNDASEDATGATVSAFPDAAAVQFSADMNPPFFGMGDPDRPVHLWHWKAVWEADRKAFSDVVAKSPPGISQYWVEGKGWVEKPSDANEKFHTAVGANNPLSMRGRGGRAEELNVAQFGSLTTAPADQQGVEASGGWSNGTWKLMLHHPLAAGHAGESDLEPGEQESVTFAIWNGKIGDRNGQKSVSVWHTLKLEP